LGLSQKIPDPLGSQAGYGPSNNYGISIVAGRLPFYAWLSSLLEWKRSVLSPFSSQYG